ncbi:MAG: acetoin dehydrogenase dihydrolipoyllysine-residue acetyltransferase subunit [Alphaproteobacteria bacterium]|nr:acetoin dehydrogenase dihydrolipoyllysine-residue acetyltransferase subunit [Alphaproteobacteria bacterium]
MSRIAAVTMPKWGLTMTEGKVLAWLKHEGDAVSASDELLEIETSKITNVMEAGESGTVRRVVAPEGATLPVGGLLAVLAPDAVDDAEIEAFVAGFVAPEPVGDEDAAAAAPAAREVEAGSYRLRYLDLGGGDGPPIVFIHGFGADLNAWMFNQPALAERHRTIALDLPGHGGSTKMLAGPLCSSGLSADVERLLAALGIGRVHLVGHSLGGGVALSLAQSEPERVESLTLIASACLGAEINATFIDGFVRMERRREAQEVLHLLVHDPALVSRQMVEDVLRYKRLDGVAQALAAIAASWFPDGVQKELLAGCVPDGLGTTRIQVIWGRDDKIIPAAHGEALAGKVPVHMLDRAGHLPHMEKAAEVNRLIAAFIDA